MFDRLTLSHLLNANVVNLSDTFSVLIREPSLKSILEIEEYLMSDILAVLGDINNVMLY